MTKSTEELEELNDTLSELAHDTVTNMKNFDGPPAAHGRHIIECHAKINELVTEKENVQRKLKIIKYRPSSSGPLLNNATSYKKPVTQPVIQPIVKPAARIVKKKVKINNKPEIVIIPKVSPRVNKQIEPRSVSRIIESKDKSTVEEVPVPVKGKSNLLAIINMAPAAMPDAKSIWR